MLGQNRWCDNLGQMWSVESGGEGKTAALAGGRYWLPLQGGPALMESRLTCSFQVFHVLPSQT